MCFYAANLLLLRPGFFVMLVGWSFTQSQVGVVTIVGSVVFVWACFRVGRHRDCECNCCLVLLCLFLLIVDLFLDD